MRRKYTSSVFLLVLLTAGIGAGHAQQGPRNGTAYNPLQAPLSMHGRGAVSAAQALISQKKYSEALKQAELAIRSDPKSGVPHMVKAFILDLQAEPQKAGNAYAKAVALSPDNGYVLNAFAAHLCQKGLYAQADANFIKATADTNYPMSYEAFENASQCSLKNNDLPLAEHHARAALSLNPESISALEAMAQIKFKQSSFFEARAFIQRREALAPLSVSLLQVAQQIEKAAGDDRAASQYQKQLDILLQAQIQPPTGEGQKKP
jgi:type IV pilus assembly protein PilF